MYQKLFSKRGLSLDRLRVLVEVAEAGGIARAVGEDPVRQSQYSRQLKELESFFEVELTRRQGRSLVLTSAGERLAILARENFQSLEDFAAACRDEAVELNIGVGESLIQWLLLPRMGSLQDLHPKLNLRLHNLRTLDVVRRLQDLRLDFGVVRRDAVPGGLSHRSLGRLEYALFVSRELANWKAGQVPPGKQVDALVRNTLQTLPLAVLADEGEFTQRFRVATAKAGISPNQRLRCGSFAEACQAVASGHYAAVLPKLARQALPEEKFLALSSPLFKNQAREIVLVWNPRILRMRSMAPKFLDHLGQTLRFSA